MPTYIFTAVPYPQGGERVEGSIDAPSAHQAIEWLRRDYLMILDVFTHESPSALKSIATRYQPIPLECVVALTHQLATMLGEEMGILQSLWSLRRQQENPRLRGVLTDVIERVEARSALWQAMQGHDDVFDQQVIAMVRAGETSGALPEALHNVAAEMDRRLRMSRQLQAATAYPKAVVGGALLAGAALLAWSTA